MLRCVAAAFKENRAAAYADIAQRSYSPGNIAWNNGARLFDLPLLETTP